jgi:soluble lytic murein transglycosylase-like protein
VTNRFDPFTNIDGGARYLKQMLDKLGAIHLALAAYNAGPNAVRKAKGIPRYAWFCLTLPLHQLSQWIPR